MPGSRSMISMIGQHCSRRMAMNIRGMSGKLNAMWNSSPVPKYGSRSSGHMLASASSRVPG